MPYAKIIGSGSYLPPRVVSNDDLAAELAQRGIETSDQWIRERTGILQRHLVEPGVKTSQLAVKAAQAALDDAGLSASDIDLLIVATSTPDFIFPSTACIVQAELGAKMPRPSTCKRYVVDLCTRQPRVKRISRLSVQRTFW